MNNQIKYIEKALQMEIIKNQINLTITKSELNALIVEGLANPDCTAAIKRALNPLLAESFPQFPDFTHISLGDTDESTGLTQVILKQPAAPKVAATKVIEEPVEVVKPTEAVEAPVTEPYIG